MRFKIFPPFMSVSKSVGPVCEQECGIGVRRPITVELPGYARIMGVRVDGE